MSLIRNIVRASALTIALQGLIAAGAYAAAPKPAQSQAAHKRYTIEQFMATTNIRGASFSKDEKRILFSSNATGIYNAYTIPVAGGEPQQLTKSITDNAFAVSFFRTDDRFLFTRDQGGNENYHLYVRELDGSERDLTPGDKVKATFFGWRPDGAAFYVMTNERDPKFIDLYQYDARTFERTLLYKNEAGMNVSAISRDGKWIALGKTNTTSDSDLYVVNLDTREMKHVTPHKGAANFSAEDFDPESKQLLYTSNADGEFAIIKAYDLASGAITDVEKADWDVIGTMYSTNGKYRVSAVNQDGSLVMRMYENGKPYALPKLADGAVRVSTFSQSGKLMAFYVNGDRSPNNLYVYDLGTKKAKQLTQSMSKEINPNDLVEAEVVRFKSFDGTVIPSIFYKPKGASASNKAPAIVYVHGGPGGQSTRGYNADIQYLVNHGYAVMAINNRGSSGYGKTFFAADDRKHGREPLWDCVEAKTWLASQGYIDAERIGIMGGSYGGYMTLAAMAFRPEAFKVGVDMFGPSNWVRTLESIPPYWEAMRKALYAEMGDPTTDKEQLVASSPLFHAANIRKPLIVFQGANDPRVIQKESDEIVEAVKKNNVPVEYVVFPDEGHGFRKKKNQAEASTRVLKFLDTYLKP